MNANKKPTAPLRQLHQHELARIENALLELFAAFGQNMNSIQTSLQANQSDGLISTHVVLPGIAVFGIKLDIDHSRALAEGMYVRCKKPDTVQPRQPEL